MKMYVLIMRITYWLFGGFLQKWIHFDVEVFLHNILFRLEPNVGPLTNFEVLSFLKSKGASQDPTRVLADVAPSEYKVGAFFVSFMLNRSLV